MRAAVFVSLCMLICLTAPATGAGRPSQVCRTLAAMLRTGLGSNSGQVGSQTLLEALAHKSRGRLPLAAWQGQGDRRAAYLRAAGMQITPELPMVSALTADQLVAVMDVGGTSRCTDITLFRSVGHRLVQIVPPYVTRTISCLRWGDAIYLGILDGKPFVAKEANDDQDIQVAPWNGSGWDSVCSVLVNYLPSLISQSAFRRFATCAEAENKAERVAVQEKSDEIWGFAYHKGGDPTLDHLLELADSTVGVNAIPPLPGWSGPDFTSPNLLPYLAKVNGRPTLAMVGEWKAGPAIDSEQIGFAVALWQEAGDHLTLAAAFHLRTSHSAIGKVSVMR